MIAPKLISLAKKYKVSHKRVSRKEIASNLAKKCQQLKVNELMSVVQSSLNKTDLCHMLQLSSKRQRSEKSSKSLENDDKDASLQSFAVGKDIVMFVDDRISERNDYFKAIKKHEIIQKNVLGNGVQGTLFRMECDDVVFARKISTPHKDERKLPIRATKVEQLFDLKHAFGDQYIAELAATTLLKECVLQNICPNLSLMYDSYVSEGSAIVDFELINGRTMKDWIWRKNRRAEHWNTVIFQTLVALWCMQVHFGMIHDDLHTSNIMISELEDKNTWLYYQIEGKKYYVPTYGYFVQLIDFGRIYTPNNKFKIRWHLKLRKTDRDRKNKFNPYTFDYHWLAKAALQKDKERNEEFINEGRRPAQEIYKWCITSLKDAYEKDMGINDIISSFFTSKGQGLDECAIREVPCYDLKPGKEAHLTTLFNLDKSLNKNKLPKVLQPFVEL